MKAIYNDLKSLFYSNIDTALGNTLINIARRPLSKRSYLPSKTKNQNIVNSIQQKEKLINTNYFVPIINFVQIMFQIKKNSNN